MTPTTVTLLRTAIASVAITLLASSIATAQTPPAPPTAGAPTELVWSVEFAQRVTGRHLIITTRDGRRYEGVVNVSPTGLETSGKAVGASVPFNQIVRVEKPTYRMRMGALIGAAAGVTFGIAAVCASDDHCQEEPEWRMAMGALWGGIGAGAGGAIGAVMNHMRRNDDILYDSNRRMTTTAVAPILSPTRKGVAVRVTWR